VGSNDCGRVVLSRNLCDKMTRFAVLSPKNKKEQFSIHSEKVYPQDVD